MCSTISFGNATQSYILYWWSGPSQSLSFWEFYNSSQTCYGFNSWLHVCISFLLSLWWDFIWAKTPRGWPLIFSDSFHELGVPFPGIVWKRCFYLSWVFTVKNNSNNTSSTLFSGAELLATTCFYPDREPSSSAVSVLPHSSFVQ